jgi:single-strand DNA-binding protein
MNKVILIGRLTRDPDIRWTQGQDQKCVARFTLAVDRRYSKKENNEQQTADFISCIAWQKTAEFMEKYIKQGTKIALEGRIQTGSYTNKDNQKVYTTDVVAENVEFAESKGSGQSQEQNENKSQSRQPEADKDGFMNIPDGVEDEGLPFN